VVDEWLIGVATTRKILKVRVV